MHISRTPSASSSLLRPSLPPRLLHHIPHYHHTLATTRSALKHTSVDMTLRRRRSSCSSPPSINIKPFYLSNSPISRLFALPQQILFAILGMVGLANYARQIVRVSSKKSAPMPSGVPGTIDSWITDNVPSLKGTFTPAWWLPNGHLQTAYLVTGNFSKTDQLSYVRTMVRVPDGGTIAMDITPPNHTSLPADAPTIVVCHGLTGNARESYVRNVLAWATLPKEKGGLGARGVVVNFRGCGGTPVTSPQMYSAAASMDLNTAAHYLRYTFPESSLHGIGFSLGASVLSRYLGERGDQSLLSSGLPVACPWDIVQLSHALEDGFWSSRLYSRALGHNLLRLFFKNYNQNKALWESEQSPIKDRIPEMFALKKLGTKLRLITVDEVMVTRTGGPQPPWPFKSAMDYYEYAGSSQLIHNIKVPTLGINAMDDPVVHGHALPVSEVQAATHVQLAVTGGGGHLGWFDGPIAGKRSRDRWVRKPIAEFLTAAARDLKPGPAVTVTYGEELEYTKLIDVMAPDTLGIEGVEMDTNSWAWVDGDIFSCQTGATPTRVGWKVLCVDVDEILWHNDAPAMQGL